MNTRILISFFILATACAYPSLDPATENPPKIRIVLAGDSTVTTNAGWGGAAFDRCFAANIEILNLSRGGRSSKSFRAEGLWQKCLALKPDYILIQFGHNDQPGHGPERETDPQTTYREFMNDYVDEARAAGIKPVLVTSMSRREWGDDGKIHSRLQPLADVVKDIAAKKNVPLIDLHARAIELYEQMGREKTLEISPLKNPDAKSTNSDTAAALNAGYDGTHLNAKGSALIGPIVARELAQAVPELAPFITVASPAPSADCVVAADGSGQFTNVQAAIAAAPDNPAKPFVILLKPGTYQGQLIVAKEKHHIKFLGEDADKTIFTYAFNQNEPSPPGSSPQFKGIGVVVVGDDFTAENVTFQNTSGDHGQAIALRVTGDRAVFNHCRMLGWQDTLRVDNGRQYFTNCYIEGRVDFIYGSGTTVFDHCEIRSKNGGHVTAANTPQDRPFGFVFMNCKLTGDPQPWMGPEGKPANTNSPPMADLGRPWRPYASVTYLNCELGAHIKPAGWNNWSNAANEKTARFAEYNSTGPGANPDQRFSWATQLTKEAAEKITIEAVLGGNDSWKPNQ